MTDQESPPANSVRQSNTPSGPSMRRYLRHDNMHIWLPFCAAAPVLAAFSAGPLVARRMTRFPRFAAEFAEEKWTFRGNLLAHWDVTAVTGALAYAVASGHQLERAMKEAKADRDYCTIEKTYHLLKRARFKHPAVLTWMLRPMEPKESADVPSVDEPIGVFERIAIALTQRQFSANYVWMLREGLEQDMRQRNISEHDITKTVLYLTGALQENHLGRVLNWGSMCNWGLILAFIVVPGFRMPRWYPTSLMAAMAMSSIYVFQAISLPLYIHDKRAVAEMLRDRLGEDM